MKTKLLFTVLFAVVATTSFAQENKKVTAKLKEKYVYVSFIAGKDYYLIKSVDDKCGLADKHGRIVVEPQYNEKSFSSLFAGVATTNFAQENNATTSFAQENEEVTAKLKEKYVYVSFNAGNDYYEIKSKNDKWGLADERGKIVVAPKYDEISYSSFRDNNYAKVKLKTKWGVINTLGDEIIAPEYEEISDNPFKYSYYVKVKVNAKWGVIDKLGDKIVAAKYDEISDDPFKDSDYARVKLNAKWGLVDKQGKTVIAPKYDEISDDSFRDNDYAKVKVNAKWGVIDKQGDKIIAPEYDEIGDNPFNDNNYAKVKVNGQWRFIDKRGKEMTYEAIKDKPFGNKSSKIELYVTVININKWFLGDNCSKIEVNGKWGVIDKQGMEIIPPKYDDITANPFKNGYYIGVMLNGKYGIVDKQGKEIIPPKYNEVRIADYDNYLVVGLNKKNGFIDKQGNEIIAPKYDDIKIIYSLKHNFYAKVKLNGKWGLIDKQGNEIITPQYDDIGIYPLNYKHYFAKVKLDGEWGLVSRRGVEVVEIKYSEESIDEHVKKYDSKRNFEEFAKIYVQEQINSWQKKGEFEKVADWQNRVNDVIRKAKVAEHLEDAKQMFITERSKEISYNNMRLGEYDPDNEVYLIQDNQFGNLLVPVPVAEAPTFQSQWNSVNKTPNYFISTNDIALANMSFSTPDGKTYTYSNQASLNYTTANIDYNFDPINLNIASASSDPPKGNQKISSVRLQAGAKSDVDTNIPKTTTKNDKTFAVIIANEVYQEVSNVDFAANDGEMFKEYCIKTLGISEPNVHYKTNATLNNIRSEINWLVQVAESYRGEASFIFYYAGHGIPDDDSKAAYLLPVDGYGSDVKSGYKLDDLYVELGAMPAQSVTVFLDACFSGAKRDGSMLAAARGVAVKTKANTPVGNMVVFSAASGDETAYPYKEKGHGLFTYFLLKKLQESKGDVTFGELSNYIATNVSQQSIVVNSKSQTPSIIPSPTLADKWQSLKLK